ncbi:MAG: LamG domain-containing protein, partial [Planctomycetes bacterium]|nr:LamG domain-containing protein [Planctomycetota bacterium]
MTRKLIYLILFALALCLGQRSRSEAANRPGLIGWWKFDELSGTTALDSSGLGNHGQFGPEGAPLRVPGVFGGAVELDGNFAYIEINSIADHLTANTFSVSAWINTTQTDDGTLIGSNGTGGSHEFIFGVDQGVLLVEEDGFNLYPPVINDGEWHHIAYTRDLATGFAYTDGVLVGTAAATGNPAGQARWSIGQEWDPPNPSDEFIGIVDDVQFYDRLLTAEEVVQVMVGVPPGQAAEPTPAHEDPDVSRDAILGWEPGESAKTHNVYFGTDFDAVNAAAPDSPMDVLASSGQEANAYDPARLEFGQTYFWRVDEVNGAPDFAVFAGNVWQFTVEPIAYPIPSVTASASSTFGISVPEKTVDGSGLADDLHGVDAADMWISGGIPVTLEYAFDRAYKLHELWIWNANQLIEGFVGFGAKDVGIEQSLESENW